MKFFLPALIYFSVSFNLLKAQQNNFNTTYWRGTLKREDGKDIVFNFSLNRAGSKNTIYITNGTEKLKVDSVTINKDSFFIKMPVFESSFKGVVNQNKLSGIWTKGTSMNELVMPFEAIKSNARFPLTNGAAAAIISGRFAVRFNGFSSHTTTSIAEFKQAGNKLTGTFLTPTGDYRFLEGVVTGNQLTLSGFDGGHAYLFTATITNNKRLSNGYFYSGPKAVEHWTAVKNAKATVKTDEAAMFLRPGEQKLNFTFPDINGNPLSINDDRFKNKVTIVQIMGSWCPNCMDETEFLSDYYNRNKDRGIEIVALAYEYSTDFSRSQKSLKKFQQRFNVQYPVLITGVTVSDTLRTEKTLPQVTPIKVFPSSVILDKKGIVRKLDTGFFGPGTGQHFLDYKKEFFATIDSLLNEN